MKKIIINENEELQGANFLVAENEITRGIVTSDDSLWLLPAEKIKKAKRLIKLGKLANIESFCETLERADNGQDYVDMSDCDQYFLWLDTFGGYSICDRSDIDCDDYYRYWDGHNFKIVLVECRTEIEASEDYEDIDNTLINNNYYYCGQYDHARLYRVLAIDGEKITAEKYLLEIWSQWEGTHATGYIVDFATAEKCRKNEVIGGENE